MSVKNFKFVSPGVFVNEVDNSQLPRLPEEMGPVIIGRAERGPAMVPVKIDSFSEFVETFGEPIAGGQADDAWRQGNRLGPTYGAFAAQAYLRNGSPITFVRLLGESHPDAGSTAALGAAGWSMAEAYGIFVDTDDANSNPAGDASDGKLAAIVYTTLSSNNADVVQASMTASGDIKVAIDAVAPSTPGSAATQVLNITGVPTAVDDFSLYHLDAQNGERVKVVDVTYDATVSSNVIDLTAQTLVIGTGNIATPLEAASVLESAINEVGAGLLLTASLSAAENNSYDITLVCDEVGLLHDSGQAISAPIVELGLNPAVLSVEPQTDGADFIAGAASTDSYVVNFDRTSKKYIRNVLNTNPTLTNDGITEQSATHFLGQSFDQFLDANLDGDIKSVTAVKIAVNNQLAGASPSSSPWVLSQYMGSAADLNAPLTSGQLTKLFRFHTLYSGEWEQKNFKISISDVTGPSNDFVKYGTFSVLVRSASDNDAAPIVYERYSNVNLDPTSPRYIGLMIGDMKMEWRDDEKRYVHTGEFENQSRFIRVEVGGDVESGAANPELLPFAFMVPAHANISNGKLMPAFTLREATRGDTKLSSPTSAYFGVSTDRPTALGTHDVSYKDLVRPLTTDADMHNAASELFSLDLIAREGTNDAKFVAGSLNGGTSLNATNLTDGEGAIVEEASYNRVLTSGFNKFTMPLVGGRDGLNILEIEPFNDFITGDGTAVSNYAYNSISKAIDTVADPEVVECNLMAIPGVATPGLTGKLVSVCEARADALAIIDLQNDYCPRGWDKRSESARLPQPTAAINALKGRGLSSSYGCAFFPWVQVSDQINNRVVWMPPSVAALGTMASSSAKSELWFAPAGFTRGGLTSGAAGIPVSQVRLRLNSKERDSLYEANINPIAQFPAEGIVVFGQKTLQFTPSALDRINVRRLMIYVKKEISRMASTVLFDQNVQTTWNRFLAQAEPFLSSVKTRFGLSEYKVILDETTTTSDLIDRNIVYAKVFLKPTRAIEFIAIDFVITNTGASFDD